MGLQFQKMSFYNKQLSFEDHEALFNLYISYTMTAE